MADADLQQYTGFEDALRRLALQLFGGGASASAPPPPPPPPPSPPSTPTLNAPSTPTLQEQFVLGGLQQPNVGDIDLSPSQAPPPTLAARAMGILQHPEALGSPPDIPIGQLKSAAHTALNVGDMMVRSPVDRYLSPLPDVPWLKPTNPAQQLGYSTVDLAQYYLPEAAGAREALAASELPGMVQQAGRIAIPAAETAAVTKVEGADNQDTADAAKYGAQEGLISEMLGGLGGVNVPAVAGALSKAFGDIPILQLLGGGSQAALAFREMSPQSKAVVHYAGQLSLGRSPALVLAEMKPTMLADIQARYPTWDEERVAAKLASNVQDVQQRAASALAQVDAASGGRATIQTAERLTKAGSDLANYDTWYQGARDIAQRHLPTVANDPINPETGLTEKQHFATQAMAVFGTNTPPETNYQMYEAVAKKIGQAPDGLTRPELMDWLQQNMIKGQKVLGLTADRPGVPGLRKMMTGDQDFLGGRKIESYWHQLSDTEREDFVGNVIMPLAMDRWMYRGFGLPTDIPKTTGAPIYRLDPQGNPIIDPRTGQPMQRGAVYLPDPQTGAPTLVAPGREVQQTEQLPFNQARYDIIKQDLMDQALAQAQARAKAGTGPPQPTNAELARIEREAQQRAVQTKVPLEPQSVEPGGRTTAKQSPWLGTTLPANVGYEVLEQATREAGRRAGDPTLAQPRIWGAVKSGFDMLHGRTGTQGYPMTEQEVLNAARSTVLPPTKKVAAMPWDSQISMAKDLIDERNAALAKSAAATTLAKSGATYSMSGKSLYGDPITAVSIFPSRAKVVPYEAQLTKGGKSDALATATQAFIRDNYDLFAAHPDDLSVGSWKVMQPSAAARRAGQAPIKIGGTEVPNGSVILDVVANTSNANNSEIARTLGMKYNQASIFDLGTGQEQPVGGMSWAARSPLGVRAVEAARPGIYQRTTTELNTSPEARAAELAETPGLTQQQRALLLQWLAK